MKPLLPLILSLLFSVGGYGQVSVNDSTQTDSLTFRHGVIMIVGDTSWDGTRIMIDDSGRTMTLDAPNTINDTLYIKRDSSDSLITFGDWDPTANNIMVWETGELQICGMDTCMRLDSTSAFYKPLKEVIDNLYKIRVENEKLRNMIMLFKAKYPYINLDNYGEMDIPKYKL
jgi:hypothetical protein